jgi:bifunctional non-homologous end joining protein LigD
MGQDFKTRGKIMSNTCIQQVVLECVSGGSDKLYVIQIQQDGATFNTVGYYGRRGSALSQTNKYSGPSKVAAEAAFSKLQSEKTKPGKDYTEMAFSPGDSIPGLPSTAPIFGGASVAAAATAAPSATAAIGHLPMLASVIETEAELETFLTDSDTAMQRKYDGERCLVSLRRGAIVATNRKGIVRGLSAGAEAELRKLLAKPDFGDDRETVLDGEIMGDEYIAYDVLFLRDNDVRELPFYERYCSLEMLLENNLGLLAETAWTEDDKRALLSKAMTNGWEGLMGRIASMTYKAGRGKAIWKWKLWASATCRVLTANAKRSIGIALLGDDGSDVNVGNVSVPVNQDIPELYGLVEVRYLYAHDGGSLFQPTLIGPRDDKDEADLRSSARKPPPEKCSPSKKEPETAAHVTAAEPATMARILDSDDDIYFGDDI